MSTESLLNTAIGVGATIYVVDKLFPDKPKRSAPRHRRKAHKAKVAHASRSGSRPKQRKRNDFGFFPSGL